MKTSNAYAEGVDSIGGQELSLGERAVAIEIIGNSIPSPFIPFLPPEGSCNCATAAGVGGNAAESPSQGVNWNSLLLAEQIRNAEAKEEIKTLKKKVDDLEKENKRLVALLNPNGS